MTSAAPAAPRETRFSRKRALIIKAAAHAFGRKGFHATTLEEIAAELKVTKASLYYYFSTKEELLFEVHRLSMEDVLARLERARTEHVSPVDQLQTVLRDHLRVLASDYEGAFLLQQEYVLPDNYREEIVRLRDEYERGFLEIVQEGIQQRLFRAKDARVVVRMILGAINWFLRWYRTGGRLTVDEIADAYMDFIFYGLLTVPAAVHLPVPPPDSESASRPRSRTRRTPRLVEARSRTGRRAKERT